MTYRIQSPRRSAFTLVELLLATAIATMLLGGMLVVVAQLAKESLQLRETEVQPDRAAVENRFADLVRLALIRGRLLERGGPGDPAIRITGNGAIDLATGIATSQTSVVTYRLVQPAETTTPLLLREQILLGDPSKRVWRELVATGVQTFSLGQPPTTIMVRPAKGSMPIPAMVSLHIRHVDSDTGERMIVVR